MNKQDNTMAEPPVKMKKQSGSVCKNLNAESIQDYNPTPEPSKASPMRLAQEERDYKIEKGYCFKITILLVGITLFLTLIFFIISVVLYTSHEQLHVQASELQEAECLIQNLQQHLNNTDKLQTSLQNKVQKLEEQLSLELQNHTQRIAQLSHELQSYTLRTEQELNKTQDSIENLILPKYSCKDLPQGSPSGYYHITTSNGITEVYCYTDLRNCSCNGTTTEWMRAANLDMTDPTQQCPDGFKLINRTETPLRTCGRLDDSDDCVSTTFPVHGTEYSNVCGRIVAYQLGSPSAIYNDMADIRYSLPNDIDRNYVAGISLTHGSPRQHIWTFANAKGEGYSNEICPCTDGSEGSVPTFVGNDYFCDTAIRPLSDAISGIFYPDDPLWDGQGCGGNSTCCEFNNPPWFCKQLPQPTTDDIELRLCENSSPSADDSPFEIVELYIN